jgi:hypothetical protein
MARLLLAANDVRAHPKHQKLLLTYFVFILSLLTAGFQHMH